MKGHYIPFRITISPESFMNGKIIIDEYWIAADCGEIPVRINGSVIIWFSMEDIAASIFQHEWLSPIN